MCAPNNFGLAYTIFYPFPHITNSHTHRSYVNVKCSEIQSNTFFLISPSPPYYLRCCRSFSQKMIFAYTTLSPSWFARLYPKDNNETHIHCFLLTLAYLNYLMHSQTGQCIRSAKELFW